MGTDLHSDFGVIIPLSYSVLRYCYLSPFGPISASAFESRVSFQTYLNDRTHTELSYPKGLLTYQFPNYHEAKYQIRGSLTAPSVLAFHSSLSGWQGLWQWS